MSWIVMYNDFLMVQMPVSRASVLSAESFRGRTAFVIWYKAWPQEVLWKPVHESPRDRGFLGFDILTLSSSEKAAVIPNWFVAVCICFAAACPWFPFSKSFSLRTLLIATTLVAVVLGLAVYVTRQ
jgi:hypothetical protein